EVAHVDLQLHPNGATHVSALAEFQNLAPRTSHQCQYHHQIDCHKIRILLVRILRVMGGEPENMQYDTTCLFLSAIMNGAPPQYVSKVASEQHTQTISTEKEMKNKKGKNNLKNIAVEGDADFVSFYSAIWK
ncbi:hypothetical protein ACJX0J_029953, partial [Zea mays]